MNGLWERGLAVTASRLTATTGILVLIGLLPWLSGHSAEYTVLRARYAQLEATPEALARVRAELGLDQGPWRLLATWVAGLFRGDLGVSWISGTPVGPPMATALGVSLTLTGFSLLVTAGVAGVAIIAPMRAGLRFRPRREPDLTAIAVAAVPSFLLAALLLVVFAVGLGWFPPYGWLGVHHAVLPSLALGIPAGAYLGRLVSDALTAAWAEDWVRTWALGGASDLRLSAAVLRRAMSGLVSQVGLVVIGVLGGAVAVEEVFAIPGLGRALLAAVSAQDVPAVQAGMLLLLGVAVVVGVLAALVRLRLVGPALRTGAVPVPRAALGMGRRTTVVSVVALAVLAGLVIAGLPRDPLAPVHSRLAPPSWALPLGADASGRDLLARLAHGAVSTVGGALAISAATLVLGILVGLLGRWAVGFIEVANALPSVIAGLVAATVAGPSVGGAALAVIATAWAPLAAHTYDLVTEVSSRPYIALKPLWGVGRIRQLVGGVLPEVIPVVARHAVLRMPGRALELASLSFLGLGPRPPSPDWGLLLAENIDYVERAPWTVLAPAIALMLAAIAAVAASARYGRR